MDAKELSIRNHAAVSQEAAAVSDAALSGNFDEARFHVRLLIAKADIAGFGQVALAAIELLTSMGPSGTQPGQGYAADLLRVADALEAARLDR
jgi:hypothetical protein